MKARLLLGIAAGFLAAWAAVAADTKAAAPKAVPPPKAVPAPKATAPAKTAADSKTAATATLPDDAQDVVILEQARPLLLRVHIRIDGRPFRVAWDKFIEYLFITLDSDGDGTLTKAEAARTPPPNTLAVASGGAFFPMRAVQAAPDLNKDGKVTREELAQYYRSAGGGPFQVQSGANAQGPYRVVMYGQSQPPNADQLNKALFALLDVNKDRKLSKEELAGSSTMLGRRDFDDDEMVTFQEVMPNYTNPSGDGVFFVAAMAGNEQQNLPPVLAVQPGEPSVQLARQLQSRYGKRGPNKKLSRTDLSMDEAAFKQLDADGDGMLDTEELSRFAKRDPDFELIVQMGKPGSGPSIQALTPPGKSNPVAPTLRKMPNGVMVLDTGSTRFQLTVNAPSQASGSVASIRDNHKAQFRNADRDKNGYLDMKEAQQRGYASNFKAIDRDGDGKLFEREVVEYMVKVGQIQNRATASCVRLSISEQDRGFFDMLDTNRDGRLGVREMRRAINLVGALDRDRDGQIGEAEVPRSYQLTFGRGPAGQNSIGVNSAVFVDYNMNQPSIPQPTAGPLWFRKMDRNRDGDVSRREFLGPVEEFRRIDTDKDDLISLQEAQKADPRNAGKKAKGN